MEVRRSMVIINGILDVTKYVTSFIPESAKSSDVLGVITSQRNYTLFDPNNELSPFAAKGYFAQNDWRLKEIAEFDDNGGLIYRGIIEEISGSDDRQGTQIVLRTRDPVGVILGFTVTLFDSTTCADWQHTAVSAGDTTIQVTSGTNTIPRGAVVSFNSDFRPNYLVTENNANVMTIDRSVDVAQPPGLLYVQLPLLKTPAALIRQMLETIGYASLIDSSFDIIDSEDAAANRRLYAFVRQENNLNFASALSQILEYGDLILYPKNGNISIRRGLNSQPLIRNEITSADIIPPVSGPVYDTQKLIIGYDCLYLSPATTISIDGISVPTWGRVDVVRGDVSNELLNKWAGANIWVPFTNGSQELKDHLFLYNNRRTAEYFGERRLEKYAEPRLKISCGLKRFESGEPEKSYNISLYDEYFLTLTSGSIEELTNSHCIVSSYSKQEHQFNIELEITNESENTFVFTPDEEDILYIGEIREFMFRRPITTDFPWLPVNTPSGTLDAANYIDFVDELRAEKLYYDMYGPAETSTFDVTAWDITSNVATLTFANAAPENNLLTALKADSDRHGGYTNWRSITLASAIGDITGGEYAITEVDTAARTIKFSFTAANNSASGAFTVEFYPYRIPGSTTTARWYQCSQLVSYAPGSDMITGLRFDDRFQAHLRNLDAGSSAVVGGLVGTGASLSGFGPDASSTAAVVQTGTYSSDGTNGTPRTGSTTRAAGLAVSRSVYVGSYVP